MDIELLQALGDFVQHTKWALCDTRSYSVTNPELYNAAEELEGKIEDEIQGIKDAQG